MMILQGGTNQSIENATEKHSMIKKKHTECTSRSLRCEMVHKNVTYLYMISRKP
jgi:hypothetical protein